MPKPPLPGKKYGFCADMVYRPLVSEPWDEKYRRNSQLVSRNSWPVYAYFLALGITGLLGFFMEAIIHSPWTPTALASTIYIALGVGTLYAAHIRR